MSQRQAEETERANVEALHAVYEEWSKGNWRPRFEIYAEDMEWGWSDEFPGLAGVSRDQELRSRRLREWLSPWQDWRCEAEEYVTAGDFVVVLTRYAGRGKESGVTVSTEGAHVWRFRGGEAVHLEVFSSRERGLAAAGIQR